MPVAQTKGDTLMAAANAAPLLILDRVGEGRVGLFLSDHPWLWARGFDGGGPHAELLRRIAHWLMKEPELEEQSLSLIGSAQSLRIERRTLETSAPDVQVTMPDGEIRRPNLQETSPGLFAATIEDAPRWLYRATSGDLFAIGSVGTTAPPEFQNVVSTREKLRPLAEKTGGGIFAVRGNIDASLPNIRRIGVRSKTRSGGNWAGIIRKKAARIEAVRERPAFSPWGWLGLMIAALGGAWWIESRRKA